MPSRARWTARSPYDMSGTLDKAVDAAAADAAASSAPAPVVLLSPACASYDQFKDFEQRGDAFRALVAQLPQDAPDSRGRRHEYFARRQGRFRQLVVHGRQGGAAGMAAADRHRPDAGFCRQPRHHRRPADRGRFPLCRAAARLCRRGADDHGGGFAAVAAPGQDRGRVGLRGRAGRVLPGAVCGRRCAGRAARTQFRPF